VVGADNSLQAYDSVTGFRKWGIDFGTPPVGAFAFEGPGAGGALKRGALVRFACRHPIRHSPSARLGYPSLSCANPTTLIFSQRTPGAGSNLLLAAPGGDDSPALSHKPAGKPAVSPSKIKGNLAGGTSVLIGALRGGLYALPADHLVLDDAQLGGPAMLALAGASALRCTDCGLRPPWPGSAAPGADMSPAVPELEHAGSECRAEDGGDGRQLVVADDDVDDGGSGLVPLEASEEGASGGLEGLVCPQLPLGLYQLTNPGEARPLLPWLPDSLQHDASEVRLGTQGGRFAGGPLAAAHSSPRLQLRLQRAPSRPVCASLPARSWRWRRRGGHRCMPGCSPPACWQRSAWRLPSGCCLRGLRGSRCS
jgi:serine/threonine-protein kinase/endoribonuclease IRE1